MPAPFTAFSPGKGPQSDQHVWEDDAHYVPGRFHAHARPSPLSASPRDSEASARPRPQRRGMSRRQLQPGEERPGGGLEREASGERTWLLRPGRERVETWLDAWWRRWLILVGIPCLVVWCWTAIPFPVSDPYAEEPPWNLPWPNPGEPSTSSVISRHRHASSPPILTITATTTPTVPSSAFFGERPTSFHKRQEVTLEYIPTPSTTSKPIAVLATRIRGSAPPPRDFENLQDPGEHELPVDANFYFFLFVYYGLYLAAALIFVTKLFDLYRLNWWPSTLGGTVSYAFFWFFSLLIGYLLHAFDLDGLGSRSRDNDRFTKNDWERKTTWVVLAFVTMSMPALACFIKLRTDRRQTYRHSLTEAQKTFLERQLGQRMPRSYKRFLWFLLTISLSLLALIVGQGFATIYLSTLPHSNIDGLVYVWTWMLTINCLNAVSGWILQNKVRSRALVFIFRFYYFLVWYVFYRNLFARLKSPDQAAYIQLLSSSWIIIWYPFSMSRSFHRFLVWAFAFDKDYDEYAESVCTMFYLRNLAENVTMVAFLGWLTILHYGPNSQVYPFFAFDSESDPYTYRLTLIASIVIWGSELVSSFIARAVIWWLYKLDVTNLGLDTFRDHPELVVGCVWAAIHVLSDLLLFLLKLNFR